MTRPVPPPSPFTSFVGRAAEMAHVVDVLRANRLVSVTGPGGCGKTRLVIELLAEEPVSDRGLVGFVELAGLATDLDVASAVLSKCGIRDEPGRDPVDRLQQIWRDRQGILVLDNCEHLRTPVAALATQLLHACPALQILITSRVALGLTGEAIVAIEGLTDLEDAVQLFLDRIRGVQPKLTEDADTRRAAREICRLTDGLPLAIEIAAAHGRSVPLSEIRDGIAGRLDTTSSDPGALPQHSSLAACIGWSVGLIGDDGRRSLEALSVIDGRFTMAAALAVLGAEANGRSLIQLLVDHSLVQFEPSDERYVLLDTVRGFASLGLTARQRDSPIYRRLLRWAAAVAASERDALTRADAGAIRRIARDEASLLSGVRYAVETGQGVKQAQQIVVDLTFAWSLQGRCAQGLELAQRLVASGPDRSCRLAWTLAFLTVYSGDVETGFVLALQAAELAALATDLATQARALTLVGMAQEFVDPAGAEVVLKSAVDLAEQAGDDWCLIESLQVLAYARLFRADHQGALECADRAMETVERLEHPQLRAWDEVVRADAAVLKGELGAALRHASTALELAQEVGEPVSAVGALQALTRALVHSGRAVDAEKVVGDARPFFAAHPGLGSSEGVELAAAMAACWSHPRSARDLAIRAHAQGKARGTPVLDGPAGLLVAYAQWAAGDREAAVEAARGAAKCATQLGDTELLCAAQLVLAADDRSAGRSAEPAYAALAGAVAGGFRLLVIDAFDLLAGVAIDASRPVVAARLHAAGTRLREELGAVCSPLVSQFRPDDEARVAAMLDGVELEAARQAGRSLDLEQAVAYASRTRGRRTRPKIGWESLTPTEHEVINLVALGLTNASIGHQLLIAPGTVRTHLRSVFGKLGVTSRSELVAIVVRRETSTG